VVAADGDRGTIVRRNALVLLSATAWLALAGCVTATVDATGEAIAADPRSWDGKWVRVEGVLSLSGHALYKPEWAGVEGAPLGWADGSMLLDPAVHYDDGTDGELGASETSVSVTGRVRAVCWEFWTPILQKMEADAEKGRVYTYHPLPPDGFPFCATVSGPYLEDALIQPIVRNDQ
jgi:hypothetical protein